MKRLKNENIRLKDGTAATLSTAQLPDGSYETMLYCGPAMTELAVVQSDTEAAALAAHKDIKANYHVEAPAGKYKDLADCLRAAKEYALAHRGSDDGGTCNFDAPTIALPGWEKAKVEAAAAEAGTGCFVWNAFGGRLFVFPIGGGQGNARTKAAEIARDFLQAAGFNAGMYYQMD